LIYAVNNVKKAVFCTCWLYKHSSTQKNRSTIAPFHKHGLCWCLPRIQYLNAAIPERPAV